MCLCFVNKSRLIGCELWKFVIGTCCVAEGLDSTDRKRIGEEGVQE